MSVTRENKKAARRWQFVLNGVRDEKEPEEWFAYNESIRYIIWSLELGKDAQEREDGLMPYHLQGYVEFKKLMRPSALREICDRCHWGDKNGNSCVGTQEDNIAYVKKTGKYASDAETHMDGPWECGTRADPTTSWKRILDDVKKGESELEIAEKYPGQWATGFKAIERAKKLYFDKPRDPSKPVEVVVVWGPPGSGKSKWAWTTNPNAYLKKSLEVKWWPGYKGESVVIVNDFRGHQMKMSELLVLIDRYPEECEQKGSDWQLNVDKWVITSNYHPSKWYKGDWNDQNPLRRRITQIIEFKSPEVVSKPKEYEFVNGEMREKVDQVFDFSIPPGEIQVDMPED